MSALPSLRHPARRGPLLNLLAMGVIRGLLAFAIVSLFAALAKGQLDLRWVVGGLLVLALAQAGLRAFETPEAERLGQRYAHSLRQRLLRALYRRGAAGRRRFGRGSLWLRLTGDLNGPRRWVSQGIARALSAAAMLSALLLALLMTQPRLAALAAVTLLLLGLGLHLIRGRALQAEAELRRARARLANRVERSLQALPEEATETPDEATRKALRRRSQAVLELAVVRARWHGLARGLAEGLPLAGLALAMAVQQGAAALPILALFSLMAGPFRDLGLAWEMRQGYQVSSLRLLDLLNPIAPNQSLTAAATPTKGSPP